MIGLDGGAGRSMMGSSTLWLDVLLFESAGGFRPALDEFLFFFLILSAGTIIFPSMGSEAPRERKRTASRECLRE